MSVAAIRILFIAAAAVMGGAGIWLIMQYYFARIRQDQEKEDNTE